MDKHSFPNGKRLVRDTLKPDDNLHYEQYADGTVKCIEDEIPFDVPDNWEWCRLQTICTKEIKRGKAPKYEEKSSVIVFAQKCNTKSGFIDISKAKFLAQNTLKKYADEDFLYYNDIIINSTGTGTLGRVGIYKKEDDIYSIKIVPDSHITTVRTIPSEINAQYIYYFLKFNQLYFENSGVGSTNQKELKPEVISTFLIAIPPLNEQNAIIDKVNMVNKHLRNLDNEEEQLKELISSTKSKILDLAIRGKLVAQDPNDEPASVLLEHIRAEKEELIKQGRIKRDKKESVIFKGDDNSYYEKIGDTVTCIDDKIPFEIPESWCWTRLNHITINHDSYRKPINSSDRKNRIVGKEKSKLYPYYGATGQVGLIDDYLFDGEYILLGEDAAPFLDKNAQKAYMIIGKSWVNNHAHILKSLILSKYLTHCLNSINYLNYVYGTTRLKLTQENMNKILIPVPPFKEQQRLIHKIDFIMGSINQINLSNKSK